MLQEDELTELVDSSSDISDETNLDTQNDSHSDIIDKPIALNTKKIKVGKPKWLFKSSTHQLGIYYEYRHRDKIDSFLLSLFVIVLQYILYSVILHFSLDEFYNPNIEVKVDMNDYCLPNEGQDKNIPATALTCEDHLDTKPEWLMIMSMTLIAIFLQQDYVSCIRILFCEPRIHCCPGKFVTLLVFIEALYATFVCSLLAYSAIDRPNGSYAAIMNTIGVLFIHDIDEKLYDAHSIMVDGESSNEKIPCSCCNRFCYRYATWIFLALIVIFAGVVLPLVLWDPLMYQHKHNIYALGQAMYPNSDFQM